jgi:hypothetical protein
MELSDVREEYQPLSMKLLQCSQGMSGSLKVAIPCFNHCELLLGINLYLVRSGKIQVDRWRIGQDVLELPGGHNGDEAL